MGIISTLEIDPHEVAVEAWFDEATATSGCIFGLHVEVLGHSPRRKKTGWAWTCFDKIETYDELQAIVDADREFQEECMRDLGDLGEAPDME